MNMLKRRLLRLYSKYLVKRYGFKMIRAKSWANMVLNDWVWRNPKTNIPFKKKLWLTKNGFGFSRLKMQGLTPENCKYFLSDFDYWRMMPLDCDYYHLINDKLSLRYVLEKFKEFLPEYYCSIDKHGGIHLLPDAPSSLYNSNDFFLKLAQIKSDIAMKPTAGAEGKGFFRYQYHSGKYFLNGKEKSENEVRSFFKSLKGYLLTEYVHQCDEHDMICSLSACALRINSIKEDNEKPFLMHSFARFGTKESGAVSNLMSGGVSIAYDSYTGYYSDKFLYAYKQNIKWLDRHPDSNISLKGKQLTNWELIRDKLIEIHEYLSVFPYMGFDVIVTNDGFKICEINSAPSVSYGQAMCYPIYKNEKAAAFFNKRLKGKRCNIQ